MQNLKPCRRRDNPAGSQGWPNLSADLAETDPGTYRIVFHPTGPFFRRVELEVELGDGHHHVPLLISSYACASYRGS